MDNHEAMEELYIIAVEDNNKLQADNKRLREALFETAQYHITIINRVNQKLFDPKEDMEYIKQDSISALENVSELLDNVKCYLQALQQGEK